ncbi:MAG TPA: endolytic transglycosylase MltG, partial [Thermoanaerobaculia bacterium]|nr:endolytic transglycosylase MltG [Thermoanaerobaculia bacterium]
MSPRARKPGTGRTAAKKNRPFFAFGLLLLLLLIPTTMAAIGWWQIQQPYKGYPEAERTVQVAPGSGATATLERLEQEGVLANSGLARVYLIYVLGNPPIQAGEYVFRGPATTAAVLQKLVRGEVATTSVTLIEGLTLEETAAHLARSGFGREEVFRELLRTPDLISDLDPQAPDLE